jgi:peptide methionine sulfoxide reductase msrA/msrB
MNWNDVLNETRNPSEPPATVVKTDEEWRRQLTAEQYRVTRQHGTESPFTGAYCESHSPGLYACICCGTRLFSSEGKFDSRSGWPSFTEPVAPGVIRYVSDRSYGMQRIEVLCNVCNAHLGHVFPDGPKPSGLRFCINSASLQKIEETPLITDTGLQAATFGGGCFWCIEAIMDEVHGITQVVSGYAGGEIKDPTYRQVCNGNTGHAEVVQVHFDPAVVTYADLLRIFLVMHNPTTKNRQGADVGTQYRSIILFHNPEQETTARLVISELQTYFDQPIVTEVKPLTIFYKAEEGHQQYYKSGPDKPYCQSVINPKLAKLRSYFSEHLKKKEPVDNRH